MVTSQILAFHVVITIESIEWSIDGIDTIEEVEKVCPSLYYQFPAVYGPLLMI